MLKRSISLMLACGMSACVQDAPIAVDPDSGATLADARGAPDARSAPDASGSPDARGALDAAALDAEPGPFDGGSSSVDASAPDADPRPCPDGTAVDVATLRALSRDGLRAFFGTTTGFDQGDLYFREGVTAANDCPSFDQTGVLYVSEIDPQLVPLELRASTRVVESLWYTNGHRYVHFGTRGSTTTPDLTWGEERSPVNACAVFTAGSTDAERREFTQRQEAAHPGLHIDLLAEIGILCWGAFGAAVSELDGRHAPLREAVMAVADEVRRSSLFAEPKVEWSPVVYHVDQILEEAVALTAANTLYPECYRTVTRAMARGGVSFASVTSFAAPFGPGWLTNPNACR